MNKNSTVSPRSCKSAASQAAGPDTAFAAEMFSLGWRSCLAEVLSYLTSDERGDLVDRIRGGMQ